MAPPFTLKEPVLSEEEEQQPQAQQPGKAEPPQQGGTRSLLADLRFTSRLLLTKSSVSHEWRKCYEFISIGFVYVVLHRRAAE